MENFFFSPFGFFFISCVLFKVHNASCLYFLFSLPAFVDIKLNLCYVKENSEAEGRKKLLQTLKLQENLLCLRYIKENVKASRADCEGESVNSDGSDSKYCHKNKHSSQAFDVKLHGFGRTFVNEFCYIETALSEFP